MQRERQLTKRFSCYCKRPNHSKSALVSYFSNIFLCLSAKFSSVDVKELRRVTIIIILYLIFHQVSGESHYLVTN